MDVFSQIFCSSVAAIVAIADHLRNSSGASRLSVCFIKLSIQESNFLRPAPLVARDVVFEAIRIAFAPISAVPTSFTIIGDEQDAVVGKGDGDLEEGEELGDDFVFEFGGILYGERVVVVHVEGGYSGSPDLKHGPINDVSQGALRIIRDCLP